jgi:hypothetical protein
VRELVLILPGLFLPDDAVRAFGSWRFAAPRPLKGGWRFAFARGLGREDIALASPASVVAASADLPSDAWLATPLHFVAGLTTLHLPAEGVLRLSVLEAEELAQQFARTFGTDGLALHPLADGSLLLCGLPDCAAETVDPALLFSQALSSAQPSGDGAASLRALMTEIEMWLHDLPLNHRRESAGLPAIRSLWLWGGGAASPFSQASAAGQAAVPAAPVDSHWVDSNLSVYAEDPWSRACCRLVGIDCAPLDLSAEFFAHLASELERGALSKLTLIAADRAVSLCPPDRWRWWRPRRDLRSALKEAA